MKGDLSPRRLSHERHRYPSHVPDPHLLVFGFCSGRFPLMDTSAARTRIRDLLRRDPTQIEEELAIHLIRTGHLYTVEEVIFGKRPFTCPIGALTPVADLILEKWNSMERTHQDGLRLQLQGLLWRIRDREVSEPGSYRTVGIDLDVETILRGIKLASCIWGELDFEQRQRIRMALQSFRASAAAMKESRRP